MNFWHMQLHPGDFKGTTVEDIYAVLDKKIIGCSGSPVPEFLKIRPNDIVLIRHGGKILALARVKENPREILDEDIIDQTEWMTIDRGYTF